MTNKPTKPELAGSPARTPTAAPTRPLREVALDHAVRALMEVSVCRKLGRRPEIASSSHQRLLEAIERTCTSEQERDDFTAQAQLLADLAVDHGWAKIGPMLKKGGRRPIFLGEEDLTEGVVIPFASSRAQTDEEEANRAAYELHVRHLVAHGMAGAYLTRDPFSVGFGGFSVPNEPEDLAVLVMFAGPLSDVLITGEPYRDDRCPCHRPGVERVLNALGIDLEGEGTFSDLLAKTGRDREYHDYFVHNWNLTGHLVEAFRRMKLYSEECDRLTRLGRIEIDPAAILAEPLVKV